MPQNAVYIIKFHSKLTDMNNQISQKEALFRFTKVFIAQYLSSIHKYDSFQAEALNMLAHYLLQMIKGIVMKVKSILSLQGRTVPNCLHLLVVADQNKLFNFEEFHNFIMQRKRPKYDLKSLQIIQRVGKKLFENDMETVNNYEKEKIYENIKYIPHIYTADLNKKALPYRHPIDQAFPLPPEITYRDTKEKITKEKKNIQSLYAYTRRQNRMAMVGILLQQQKKSGKRQSKEDNDDNRQIQANVYGSKKKKRFAASEELL